MANAANQAQPPLLQPQPATPQTPADMVKRNRVVCLTASSVVIVLVAFCMIWSQVDYFSPDVC